jgi:histidinol-phosphatase
MATHTLDHDLALALELADLADGLSLTRFGSVQGEADVKADGSPVGEVDMLVEHELRVALGRTRPDDAVLGEEGGEQGGGRRRWVIDPIDGTKNYLRGIPVYATQIALEIDGRVRLGVVSAPALGRRWWASEGSGAFADGRSVHVSGIATLERSTFLFAPSLLRSPARDATMAMIMRCTHTRGIGNFWMHMLVAEGAAEVAAYHTLGPWDDAPVRLIVQEAGGCVWTPSRGEPPSPGLIATNDAVHRDAVAVLSGREVVNED